MIVVDTDFLSTFLKIEELELVLEELTVDEIFVPVQVEKELLDELEQKMDDRIKVEDIEPIENEELGKGERAVIALADHEDLVLMNDRKACEKAAERGLNTVTIPGFLKVLDDGPVRRVACKLREKDSYRFSEEDREKLGLN